MIEIIKKILKIETIEQVYKITFLMIVISILIMIFFNLLDI